MADKTDKAAAKAPQTPASEAQGQKIRIGSIPIRLQGKCLAAGAEIPLTTAQVALLPAGSFTVISE
jgi:hypothetical protein